MALTLGIKIFWIFIDNVGNNKTPLKFYHYPTTWAFNPWNYMERKFYFKNKRPISLIFFDS
jgi:hypothetical protein